MTDTSDNSMDSENSDDYLSYVSENSLDLEDEVDEDFYKTIQNILDKVFDFHGVPPHSIATNPSKITDLAKKVVKLMGWFYETKWLWDTSTTLTTIDAQLDPTGEDTLQQDFKNLILNNYMPQIEAAIKHYFD